MAATEPPNEGDVVQLAENLAARIPELKEGERVFEIHYSGGRYRTSRIHMGPLKPDDLRSLGR